MHLSIWDTAGQERFHALGPIYYRDSHGEVEDCKSFCWEYLHAHPGAILVYDITDEDSFHKVGHDHQLFLLKHHSNLLYVVKRSLLSQCRLSQKVQSWVKELKKMLGSDISLVIAGNKVKMNKRRHCAFSLPPRKLFKSTTIICIACYQVDLEKNRNVDRAAAERYADSVSYILQ